MTSEKQRRNSILITRHYPDLGSVSDWLNQIFHSSQAIRSTTQIWVVTRYHWNFCAVCQTSFGGETSGGVAKCRLFSQAAFTQFCRKSFVLKTLSWQVTFILTITRAFKFFNLPIWGRSESLHSWAVFALYFLPPWWRIFIHYSHKKKKTNQEVCLPLT